MTFKYAAVLQQIGKMHFDSMDGARSVMGRRRWNYPAMYDI